MSRIEGFLPVEDGCATLLILGSMPGAASLAAGEYYAHPRNHFWKLMAAVVGLDAASPYIERVDALRRSGVALWDVLHACSRKGSLDSAIERDTLVVNDFENFYRAHPEIRRVFFNGASAEQFYRREVMPRLSCSHELQYFRLPSSSPANATLSFESKLAQWRSISRSTA